MKKNIPKIEIGINDMDDELGIDIMSLVSDPAVEKDFLYFNDTKQNYTLAKVDSERRTITGPALIPDKDIYRFNKETNEEYYVWFSKETVRKIAEKFMIQKKLDAVNIEHNPDAKVSDVSLIEAWMVTDPTNDKANALGYSVNEGTFMVTYKINNDEVLAKIKSGEVKGFSIEGPFVQKFGNQSEPTQPKETTDPILDADEEQILALIADADEYTKNILRDLLRDEGIQ